MIAASIEFISENASLIISITAILISLSSLFFTIKSYYYGEGWQDCYSKITEIRKKDINKK